MGASFRNLKNSQLNFSWFIVIQPGFSDFARNIWLKMIRRTWWKFAPKQRSFKGLQHLGGWPAASRVWFWPAFLWKKSWDCLGLIFFPRPPHDPNAFKISTGLWSDVVQLLSQFEGPDPPRSVVSAPKPPQRLPLPSKTSVSLGHQLFGGEIHGTTHDLYPIHFPRLATRSRRPTFGPPHDGYVQWSCSFRNCMWLA